MRTHFTLLALVAALSLGACAAGDNTYARAGYSSDLDRLQAQCDARGGLLLPLGAGGTGQASTDYFCDIRNPGARFDGPTGALTSAP